MIKPSNEMWVIEKSEDCFRLIIFEKMENGGRQVFDIAETPLETKFTSIFFYEMIYSRGVWDDNFSNKEIDFGRARLPISRLRKALEQM